MEVSYTLLFQVFLVNTITGTLALLRTLYIGKNLRIPLYTILFFESLFFVFVIGRITHAGASVHVAVAFAAGKILGAILGRSINRKLPMGNFEFSFFVSAKDLMIEIADLLRDKGFSVNTSVKYGYKGSKRYEICVISRAFSLKEIDAIGGKMEF